MTPDEALVILEPYLRSARLMASAGPLPPITDDEAASFDMSAEDLADYREHERDTDPIAEHERDVRKAEAFALAVTALRALAWGAT